MGPPADRKLVARLREGDATALRSVYACFSDPVFGFLLRLLGRRGVAEDLHQETWLSVSRHAHRLAEDTDLAAWIFTIARNEARSWRRWAALDFTRLGVDLFETDAPSEAPAPDAGDERAALEVALMALPAAHREVLLLVGGDAASGREGARGARAASHALARDRDGRRARAGRHGLCRGVCGEAGADLRA